VQSELPDKGLKREKKERDRSQAALGGNHPQANQIYIKNETPGEE